jgi:hypothetical protein
MNIALMPRADFGGRIRSSFDRSRITYCLKTAALLK